MDSDGVVFARALSTTCLNPNRAARRDGFGVGVDLPEVGVLAPSREGGTKDDDKDAWDSEGGITWLLSWSQRSFDGVVGTPASSVDAD
jgi:hypothetical protein